MLAELLAAHAGGGARAALQAYEELRLAPMAQLVLTNRTVPPDFINIKVDELSGGKPFANIDELISQQDLREISDNYKKVAGFSLETPKAG